MPHRILAAIAVAVSLSAATALAQSDQEMACSMAPGLALGLDGIEQMDQGFAMIGSQMDQMRVSAPEVAALMESFMAESAEFASVYRYTVGELQRICGQKP